MTTGDRSTSNRIAVSIATAIALAIFGALAAGVIAFVVLLWRLAL